MMSRSHSDYLLHARELALRGHGLVEPNPMVGCVIVNDQNKIIGSGFHEKCGEAHAEINALNKIGALANGATAYITLEPCNHQGKTGPCSHALLNSGISKVVIGCKDPSPEASGGGEFLSNNGVEVVFENNEQCKKIIAPFVHRLQTGLPWVICKWAQTSDGYIETPEGESPWISGKESLQLVHEKRGCVDAIIAGVGTVVADNPSLTVRNAISHRTPLRVVVDPTLRIPLDLHPLMKHLVEEYDATNVIVEGGKTLFEHILNQQLANELWIFTSQRIIGEENLKNMTQLFNELHCTLENKRSCGDDLVCRYRL